MFQERPEVWMVRTKTWVGYRKSMLKEETETDRQRQTEAQCQGYRDKKH